MGPHKKLFCEYLQEYLERDRQIREAVQEAKENLGKMQKSNKTLDENIKAILHHLGLTLQELMAYQEVLCGKKSNDN